MKTPKEIVFGAKAREALMRGANLISQSVSTSLGPKSYNTAINQPYGPPLIVHDGVTIAKSIDLTDPFEDMGAQMVKFASIKTNDKAGDGTTTATILAQAILEKGFEIVAAGANPMMLKQEIDSALVDCLKELKLMAKPIKTDKELENVATISSADPTIGKLVSDTIIKVGKDGVIRTEEGKSLETVVELKQGTDIDRGYLSRDFVTDKRTNEAIIENPYILITDKKFNYNFEIVPFIDKFLKETGSKDLVIICSEMLDEALSTVIINNIRGAIRCSVIQAPSFGMMRQDELTDLAVLTGGSAIFVDSGRDIATVGISELGRAEKVISGQNKTTFIGGKGTPEAIANRVEEIKYQISISSTDYEKDVKGERLAKMTGGVAIINVGAATEVELRDKKERVIDAVNATKAAVEEGIVAGGEITLLALSLKCKSSILEEALKKPFKILMENSGIDYGEARAKVGVYPVGIDVMDGQVKDLIKAGIIDPVKVTRLALENAVSVATMGLTTKVLVSDIIPEIKTK